MKIGSVAALAGERLTALMPRASAAANSPRENFINVAYDLNLKEP